MALKVIIPPGQTQITINGLHQWDYGRQLEIVAEELPAMVEVHFAYKGMETAVVRSCRTSGGSVIATIPDICLEQTAQITAWVYEFEEVTDETTGELVRVRGKTILTVTLPIIPRALPQPGEPIPEEVCDKYTEAVAAMNALVAECEEIVKNAADEVEERLADDLYESGWTARYADMADKATWLDGTPVKSNAAGLSNYKIDSTGLYVVVFKGRADHLASALIAITDLKKDMYGADTTMGQPVYEALYQTLTVYTSDGTTPITAVYKLTDK